MSHGRAARDDQPIQDGYRSHRATKSGASPRRDGYPRSGFRGSAAEARWLAGQLGAESLIVEGAGHYPHTEMPDLLAPKLLSFIGGVHGRSSANL
jgi:hypothetical protein